MSGCTVGASRAGCFNWLRLGAAGLGIATAVVSGLSLHASPDTGVCIAQPLWSGILLCLVSSVGLWWYFSDWEEQWTYASRWLLYCALGVVAIVGAVESARYIERDTADRCDPHGAGGVGHDAVWALAVACFAVWLLYAAVWLYWTVLFCALWWLGATPAPSPTPKARDPNALQTSENCPQRVDFLARVPAALGGDRGAALGLTHCPGRNKGRYARNAAADAAVIAAAPVAADTVVTLVTDAELVLMRNTGLVDALTRHGMTSVRLPLRDKWAPPSARVVVQLCEHVVPRLRAGQRVVLHCNGGKGRAATIASALLICGGGLTADQAIAAVQRARRGALRNPLQRAWLQHFERSWHAHTPHDSPVLNPIIPAPHYAVPPVVLTPATAAPVRTAAAAAPAVAAAEPEIMLVPAVPAMLAPAVAPASVSAAEVKVNVN